MTICYTIMVRVHELDLWNVHELTKNELKLHVNAALTFLRDQYYSNPQDFYIDTANASPQVMRGWLIKHFPHDYKVGTQPTNSINKHYKNRGITYC